MAQPEKFRRIITGIGDDGVSHIARVEDIEQLNYDVTYPTLGSQGADRICDLYRVWAIDDLPVKLPQTGMAPPINPSSIMQYTPEFPLRSIDVPEVLRHISARPDVGGVRISFIKFKQTDPETDEEPNENSPLHWHPTVDIRIVIAGSCTFIMDSGERVTVGPGDCIVSNSDNHRFRVDDPDGCTLAIVMLGGEVVGRMPPAQSAISAMDQNIS